jgi:hypothetical protein
MRAPWQDRAAPGRGALKDALRLGLPAFPCGPDKRPTTPNRFYNATSDPDGIRRLWRDHPGPLIGVPTGEATGLFVLDIDSAKHDEAQDWLERYAPYLPETRRHQTKSGGLHFLFQHPGGLRSSQSKLAPGVDTRGDGGYVIWWPLCLGLCAKHNFGLIAPMPDWLISELRPPPPRFESVRPQVGKSIGESNAKVQGVLNKVAQAREGNRNGILFWGACCIGDMVANRELSGIEASRSLQALHNISLQTGLSAREITRTINSAMVRR